MVREHGKRMHLNLTLRPSLQAILLNLCVCVARARLRKLVLTGLFAL